MSTGTIPWAVHIATADAEKGVLAGDMTVLTTAQAQAVGSLLGSARREEALLTAIVIPTGVTLAEPIRLTAGEAADTHIVVFAGQDAQAAIVEEIQGAGERTHAVEVFAAAGTQITYASLHDASETLRVSQRSQVEAGARVTWRTATLAPQVTHDVLARLTGANATSDVDWLFFAADADRQDLSVRNVFDAPDGAGEILMKGVAEGKGQAKCRGLIDIGRHGGGTNTYLTQDVLMLDPTAKVDAVPGLEIKTNDVKASHSAIVSRVTDEDLFYFAARCIPAAEARSLFVHGFLGEIAERFPAGGDTVLEAIGRKMRGEDWKD
jgi:Fe-S cluster assembly protein SufB